jgi:type I restriction enzyme S subunit
MPRFSIAISSFDMGEKFKSNSYKLSKYDMLYGSIRPYFGKVAFSPINGVVTGTILSLKTINDNYFSFLLSLISSKRFIEY